MLLLHIGRVVPGEKVYYRNFNKSAISRNLDVLEIKNTKMSHVQVHAARFSGSTENSVVAKGVFFFLVSSYF